MKVILSPAKNLNTTFEAKFDDYSEAQFLEDSRYLINKLRKLSRKKIAEMMKISPALVELNHERYQNWSLPFKESNAIPAIYIFAGEVYRALDAKSFNKKDLKIAQKKIRILSGLYGILKPKDLMQAYRLEMGTRIKLTSKINNLYQFWGDKLTDNLNNEFAKNDTLVNLASKEYFKAIDFNRIEAEVVTCVFKDNKNGVYKNIMTFAKLARGRMANYIVKNNISKTEELKTFDVDGYIFNPKMSSKEELTFTRG